MNKGQILYPCYFDSDLRRSEGRRVPGSLSVQSPAPGDIERILKSHRIRYQRENRSHPSFWWKQEGRFVVEYDGTKRDLIRLIGTSLRDSKKT